MITGFACGGVVGCVPAPHELLEGARPLALGEDDTPSDREERIPGWAAAEAKLRRHWSLLGFKKVQGRTFSRCH